MKIDKREKYKRNLEICKKKSEGMSWTVLSREYQLTIQRLQSVVKRQKEREAIKTLDNI